MNENFAIAPDTMKDTIGRLRQQQDEISSISKNIEATLFGPVPETKACTERNIESHNDALTYMVDVNADILGVLYRVSERL